MDEKEAALARVKESCTAMAAATAQYETDVRAAKALGVKRARLMDATGRSGEQIRQDGLPAEERAAIRAADAERKRRLRDAAAKA